MLTVAGLPITKRENGVNPSCLLLHSILSDVFFCRNMFCSGLIDQWMPLLVGLIL